MRSKISNKFLLAVVAMVVLASCSKKLDLFPQNDLTPEKTYSTAAGYKSVLAKIYGTLAVTGNQGAAGQPDINGLDEGSQVAFIRGFFNAQELPTDEAVVSWNDQTIKDFHNLRWTSADPFLKGLYARPIYNITLINEFLREATDAKLQERSISGTDATDIKNARAEVKFLRAFNYWVMMDLFGKSTFITEDNKIGTDLPGEIDRKGLFAFIETQLKQSLQELAPAKTIEYGRVDQAAAWALLARMYLNAPVYLGIDVKDNKAIPYYDSAVVYSSKVIGAGYTLKSGYAKLFMADNDKQKDEFIWTINCDGLRTSAYGNTTFLVHAASGDNHDELGVGSGWSGYRATKGLADLFPDLTGATDQRAMFANQANMQINDIGDFKQGLWVKKWRNIRSDGQPTSDPNRDFADIDFPVFRLPEMYFIYTEGVLRGSSKGDLTTALDYMNRIRFRAYGDSYGPSNVGKLVSSDLTLQLVLDERGRELYWEGHRRTDLVRYNLLTTGTYLWPWKGGVASGTAVNSRYNYYPVPSTNLTSNPNLTQNAGY
ncbi:RagB/SusD family nutrient uptake outer membrane protein [Flavisolibacter nicotianae]|uniref:RagB/SusD family nutrient uptake outer membrane protein n=1 Tax=Flavisolibacter nicotianae TaxID=2364882 RepID=UPI000EAB748A|nr:RagB/SusD family nutrient uptake outer membrane protein [Flavisolibacter nicotianae]